jgi:hypothetical protein
LEIKDQLDLKDLNEDSSKSNNDSREVSFSITQSEPSQKEEKADNSLDEAEDPYEKEIEYLF